MSLMLYYCAEAVPPPTFIDHNFTSDFRPITIMLHSALKASITQHNNAVTDSSVLCSHCSTFKSERGVVSSLSAAMSPAGWSAVLEARRAYAPGTSAKPSAMPGSVMQNRTRPVSAKKRCIIWMGPITAVMLNSSQHTELGAWWTSRLVRVPCIECDKVYSAPMMKFIVQILEK